MRINYRSGQSLLVIVLLIAVVFTLIASASYRLTTETQSARIQEDTVKTLAAADSGIEKGIQMLNDKQQGTFLFKDVPGGLTLSGIDSTKSSIDISSDTTNIFVSPLVQKDDQYTFYLYDYPNGTSYYNGNMTIYFAPASSSCGASRTASALEISVINAANNIYRWVVEPCGSNPRIQSDSGTIAATAGSYNPGGLGSFSYSINFTQLTSITNPKLLIIRPLFASTTLGFQRSGSGTFFTQGQTITAEAVSTTGISKVVTLFRSYPQIPADFFVTTF